MHELFLTAPVRDDDFEMACAVLQGITWMTARHNLYRISFFSGQPYPRGLVKKPALPAHLLRSEQGRALAAAWDNLSKQLTRSSYVLKLVHEVFADSDFGTGRAVDLNAVAGTLCWTDFPDPLRDTPVTQRNRIDIPDQRNLLSVMHDNGHGFKTELIQETFTFTRENIELVFSRHYYLPDAPGKTAPVPSLPPWDQLRLVDPARKWTLNVKLNVMEDNHPEKMKKATEELMHFKGELDSIFDFKVIDRRIFDTRVGGGPGNAAIPLPTK